ncbi:hypothetical protein PCANC_28268 [Puccinia coronata f. sp. avenae]|nr:hypothetical protein PCANC_28268 [Puccinia coronata f. sp. avenae]
MNLRTKLILGYLGKMKGLLSSTEEGHSSTMRFFRELVEEFMSKAEDEDFSQQSFVDFFLRASPPEDEPNAKSAQISDAITTRAKLLVCLDQSGADRPNYDARKIRSIIEDMGGCAELLAVERAMVYSKIGLHRPALSLLALSLKDIRSADTYCLQRGSVLSSRQTARLLEAGGSLAVGSGGDSSANEATSTDELVGILFDLLITSPARSGLQVRLLLSRHAARIPLHTTLERLPENWPLDPCLLGPYLSRAFRRSCHQTHEATIVKAITLGNHISLAVAYDDLLLRAEKH